MCWRAWLFLVIKAKKMTRIYRTVVFYCLNLFVWIYFFGLFGNASKVWIIWAVWRRDVRKESARLPSFHCKVIAVVMTLLSGLYIFVWVIHLVKLHNAKTKFREVWRGRHLSVSQTIGWDVGKCYRFYSRHFFSSLIFFISLNSKYLIFLF